jgi:hypothetical protein
MVDSRTHALLRSLFHTGQDEKPTASPDADWPLVIGGKIHGWVQDAHLRGPRFRRAYRLKKVIVQGSYPRLVFSAYMLTVSSRTIARMRFPFPLQTLPWASRAWMYM